MFEKQTKNKTSVTKYFFLTVIAFCAYSNLLSAQNVNLNQNISITTKDSTLEYFLNKLSYEANINFSYNPDAIPVDSIIKINASGQTLGEILNEILSGFQLEYSIVEEQIIVKKKVMPAVVHEKPKVYTISGYIKEIKTTETLIGATVYVEGTTTGTITNSYGFFSLSLPEGEYDIVFSFIGLQIEMQKIKLEQDIKLNVELYPNISLINEVVVSAAESENISELNQMSELKVLPKTINNMSGFMGEPDLIKSFQLMPGIKLMGDGSTFFYVRGGHSDQNLILIDEAPIYNAAHLFGVFSVFVNDAIKDIQVYKGDMPVEHGGRLSSLVDVKTKDGNMEKYHFSGDYGLVSANMTAEGPIRKNKSSFLISARRSHLKWILGQSKDNLNIYFYDFNTKFNRKINSNNRIYFSFYHGKDYLGQINNNINSSAISWGNAAATIRWNHIFSDKLFSNIMLSASKYNYFLYLSVEKDLYWNSFIGNGGIKADFTYYLNPKNTLKFGLASTDHSFNPGNLEHNGTGVHGIPVVPKNQAHETILYLSNQQILSDKFSLRYGLRYSKWANVGPTTVYLYDDNYLPVKADSTKNNEIYNVYRTIEPRLNLNYKINEKSSIKASYVNTSQNIHMLSNSISPFTSLEVWFPSNPTIKPERANQFAIGLFRKDKIKQSDFSSEIFYKKMKNQIDYEDHAKMLLNPLIDGELRFGTTKAYGLELSYHKTSDKLDAWLSYTYSRSLRTTEGINFNNEYPSPADRPNDFSIHLSYKKSNRWQFNMNWMYISGSVFSSPTSFFYYRNYSVPIYLYKNNDRLPDYHRMDISIICKLNGNEQQYNHLLTFGIYNLYGRKNPVTINFSKTLDDNENLKIPGNLYDAAEIVPTQMNVLGFMPSLTYSFNF